MIYLVKHIGGIEIQVTEEVYRRCLGKKDYECRIVDMKPIEPAPPVKFERTKRWPKKDETGPWYTLSNGKRFKGKRNAEKEEAKL
jgi:hypothetical protein